MAYRTATFDGGADFGSYGAARGIVRRLLRATFRHLVLATCATATVATVGGGVVFSAIWLVGNAGITNPHVRGDTRGGPARLALAYDAAATGSIAPRFETAWAPSRAIKLTDGRPLIVDVPQPAAPQVAALTPPPVAAPEKRVAPIEAHNREPAPTDSTSRTAVYDISTSTVYMPDGRKLEAHSGLHDKMDDPRYIKMRMRGPTPPNVYVLTEREQLFHGVRAIRLNPVDRDRMFGRDGMLAHTYMLGPNGQSNGCVSFKNYDRFLEAFLDGKVDKLVVVGNLGNAPWRTAAAQAEGVDVPARRYASGASRSRRYAAFFGAEEPAYSPVMAYATTERGAGTW